MQVLFNSAEGVANCSQESMTFELMRFILDQTIAVIAFNILYISAYSVLYYVYDSDAHSGATAAGFLSK